MTEYINTLTFALKDMALLRKIVYAFDQHLHMVVTAVLQAVRKGKGEPIRVVGMRSCTAVDGVYEVENMIGEQYSFWLANGIMFFKVGKVLEITRKIGVLYWRIRKPDLFVKVDGVYMMRIRILYAMSAAIEAGLDGFAGELRDMVEEGVVE